MCQQRLDALVRNTPDSRFHRPSPRTRPFPPPDSLPPGPGTSVEFSSRGRPAPNQSHLSFPQQPGSGFPKADHPTPESEVLSPVRGRDSQPTRIPGGGGGAGRSELSKEGRSEEGREEGTRDQRHLPPRRRLTRTVHHPISGSRDQKSIQPEAPPRPEPGIREEGPQDLRAARAPARWGPSPSCPAAALPSPRAPKSLTATREGRRALRCLEGTGGRRDPHGAYLRARPPHRQRAAAASTGRAATAGGTSLERLLPPSGHRDPSVGRPRAGPRCCCRCVPASRRGPGGPALGPHPARPRPRSQSVCVRKELQRTVGWR